LTGSLDGTARLWDVVSGKELLTLRGHSSAVTSVAFSSDGLRVVTGSWDQTARVWVAATPKQVTAWMSQDALMTGLADRGLAQQKARAARAEDPGAIKEWLVLAPVPLHGEDACTAWAEDQIPQERQLHPRAGERQTVGEVELVWSAVRRADPLIDFSEILNFFVRSRASAAYAVCYIHAEAAQSDLVLRVASADTARVYLNEREVYRWKLGSARPPKQDIVRGVALNAGLNVMVFKVLVEKGPTWEGSVCLTDAAGQPVKGVRVSLDPDHVGGP
jgi:hypothetical protein